MKTLLLTTIITLGLAITTANASMEINNAKQWNMNAEEYQEENEYTLKTISASNETNLDRIINESFKASINSEDADFQ